MISDNRTLYYAALDDSDAAWLKGRLDVSSMEQKVSELLAKQLVQIAADAGGL